jgi:hypothetical protein
MKQLIMLREINTWRRYKANLPASSFGIQAAANGGRITYGDGTKPSAEEKHPLKKLLIEELHKLKI